MGKLTAEFCKRERKMATYSRIAKWIIELAADKERNPHGLTACQIADRHYNRKWSLEEILNTPLMTRSEAGRRNGQKSHWHQWNPDWLKSEKKD